MPYCSRCGVEVEARATSCPLCSAPIQQLDDLRPGGAASAEPGALAAPYPEIPAPRAGRARYLVWIASTAALLSAASTSLALDVVPDREVSWSLYALTGVGVLWLFITLVVLLARRPIFVIVGQAVATAAFLLLIDLFDRQLDWFAPLALPIVLLVTAACVLVWLVARATRRDPAAIAASVLLTAAAGCLVLDLLVTAHQGAMAPSWSLIVICAVLPPAVLLIYLHFRFLRRMDLSRVLHS